jgi:hypothetical protein
MITIQELCDRYDMSHSSLRKILRELGITTTGGAVCVMRDDILGMLRAISQRTLKEASVASCIVSGSIKYNCLLQKRGSEPVYAVFKNSEIFKTIPCIELEKYRVVKVDTGIHLTFLEDEEIVEFHVSETPDRKTRLSDVFD